MPYRCEALSVEGFVQMLAAVHLKNGHYFYVPGRIPDGKAPKKIDQKLIKKYGIDLSKATRSRLKKDGQASVHYLRYQRTFLLLATYGEHTFFEEEVGLIKDCRRTPIRFAGYAISVKKGHACVRIQQEVFSVSRGIMYHPQSGWFDEGPQRGPTHPGQERA
ncbi:MAG: hypothetical protein AB7N91_31320 [Candidatus Tectimicrobiota bacterium]